MNTEPIEIESRLDGIKVDADLMVCTCGCKMLFAYVIRGQNHPHLQCVRCGLSYCADKEDCSLIGK
jgi:hypothetical protein